jgi:microcystin degradation protein MlrC
VARTHSRKDWAALKAAYRRGEGTIAVLGPRFGIPKSTAEKRCAREKWQVERQVVGQMAEAKAREQDVESIATMLARHRRLANRLLVLAERRLEEVAARSSGASADQLDTLSKVLGKAARQERLAAGIEPAKPVMAFETAGSGAVLRVKRRGSGQEQETPAAAEPGKAAS